MPRLLIQLLLIWLPLTVSAAGATGNGSFPVCEVRGMGDAIIVYDSLGGMTARTGNDPRLAVYASGSAILGDPYGAGRRIESRLEPVQVQHLLDIVVDKYGFFNIDTDAIAQEMNELQTRDDRVFAIADAGQSLIRVCTGTHAKEVKFYALDQAARQFPEIPALQHLHAIEQELRHTATWIRVGGDAGARAILASVNEQLSREHPEIEPLALENLDAAFTAADGSLSVYFSRRGPAQQGPRMRNISVISRHKPGQETRPSITINLE